MGYGIKLIAESRRKRGKIDAQTLCELLRLDGLSEPVHMPGSEDVYGSRQIETI